VILRRRPRDAAWPEEQDQAVSTATSVTVAIANGIILAHDGRFRRNVQETCSRLHACFAAAATHGEIEIVDHRPRILCDPAIERLYREGTIVNSPLGAHQQ
jgi:hypothetical protein